MKRADFIVPGMLLTAVMCILIPLPGWLLDVLLSVNLIFAVLLFVGALHIKDPLEITGLPSLLLLATLIRLSLNLATTRSILTTGHAGELVSVFGGFVVGGNVVVGLILFILVTIVQFLVVAKGSERVAEVSARFTLDALPGKQMSIDADVRAGLLDAEGARKKRHDLQTESRFYGALDGAMKFVKGDAVAGMIITVVNLVGGLLIGVLSRSLDISQAASLYSLLSIGDGLLSQLPSLLNAVAAGMVVTRVGRVDGGSLASELLEQIGSLRAARAIAACSAAGLAFVPGMPYWILGSIALAGLLTLRGRKPRNSQSGDTAEENLFATFDPPAPAVLSICASVASLRANYVPIVSACQDFRSSVFARSGVLLDAVSIRPRNDGDTGISIDFHGTPLWQSSDEGWEAAQVRDILEEFARESLTELVDDSMTRRLLDLVERKNPELVTNSIPTILSTTQLTSILRSLVSEGIPIHGIEPILQVAAELGAKGSERRIESEVRVRLRRSITQEVAPNKHLRAIVVSPIIDVAVSTAEERGTMIPEAVYRAISEFKFDNDSFTVVASKRSRSYIRDILRARGLKNRVVAGEELGREVQIDEEDVIDLDQNDAEEVIHALAA